MLYSIYIYTDTCEFLLYVYSCRSMYIYPYIFWSIVLYLIISTYIYKYFVALVYMYMNVDL